jgi:hypothetical protein
MSLAFFHSVAVSLMGRSAFYTPPLQAARPTSELIGRFARRAFGFSHYYNAAQ